MKFSLIVRGETHLSRLRYDPDLSFVPDALAPPKGCPFAARCEFAMKVCYENQPEIENIGSTTESYYMAIISFGLVLVFMLMIKRQNKGNQIKIRKNRLI